MRNKTKKKTHTQWFYVVSRYTSHNAYPQPGSFWTVHNSYNTQDMLPQHQLNVTM